MDEFPPYDAEGTTEYAFGNWRSQPPDEQLRLPGLDDPESFIAVDKVDRPSRSLGQYTLFFALIPDEEDALRIAAVGEQLHAAHGLTGRLLQSDRLHVSLQSIGAFNGAVPALIVDAASAVARSVRCSRFQVVFDAAQSFQPSNAFVLGTSGESASAIARLRQSLASPLRRMGLRSQQSRTPHMTLLYDKRRVDLCQIQPIRWTVNHFVLILSHVGLTHHQRLGVWHLTG